MSKSQIVAGTISIVTFSSLLIKGYFTWKEIKNKP
jgi:hypothetical protein